MLLGLWPNSWEEWLQYQKVTFDGINKIIYVNYGVTELNFQIDVYSAWKEWIELSSYNNSKYEQALRTVGGDPINETDGRYLGATFFLVNGWKMQTWEGNHTLNITGNVYVDDPDTYGNFIFLPISGNYRTEIVFTVSNLIDSVRVPLDLPGLVTDAVWNALLSMYQQPGSMGEAMGAAASGGVLPSVIADAVWNAMIASYNTAGTFGSTNQTPPLTATETENAVWE